jgi:hypothetical protein
MRGKPGQIKIEGDEIGGDGGNLNELVVTTAVAGGTVKTRTLEVRDGIITVIGSESDWTAPTYYTAAGATLSAGSDTIGSLTRDLQVQLDGNVYQIGEEATTPGAQLDVTFENVTSISNIVMRGYYAGGTTHAVRLQMYNYSCGTWDTIHTIKTAIDFEQHFKAVTYSSNYISDGTVQTRIIHSELGK